MGYIYNEDARAIEDGTGAYATGGISPIATQINAVNPSSGTLSAMGIIYVNKTDPDTLVDYTVSFLCWAGVGYDVNVNVPSVVNRSAQGVYDSTLLRYVVSGASGSLNFGSKYYTKSGQSITMSYVQYTNNANYLIRFGHNKPFTENGTLFSVEGQTTSDGSRPNDVALDFAADTFWEHYLNSPTIGADVDIYSSRYGIFNHSWFNISGISTSDYGYYGMRIKKNGYYSYVPGSLTPISFGVMDQMGYDSDFLAYLLDTDRNTAYVNKYVDLDIELVRSTPGQGSGYVVEASARVRYGEHGSLTVLSQDGLTIHTYANTSTFNDDNYNPDTTEFIQQVPGQEMSIDNLLTTTYALDDATLIDFGAWLWANNLSNLEGNQTCPIENVLSCKRIPFDIESTSPNAEIRLGNVGTGISGGNPRPGGGSNYYVKKAVSYHSQYIGALRVPCYSSSGDNAADQKLWNNSASADYGKSANFWKKHTYGTFIDMQNKISIYLPYCGVQMLPTSSLYKKVTGPTGMPCLQGRVLHVVYYYDIIYATCAALVYYGGSVSNGVYTPGTLIAVFNGSCGVDIPVTASNRASNELALQKAGLNTIAGTATAGTTGLIGGLMSGNLIGGLLGGAAGAIGANIGGQAQKQVLELTQDTHFTTSGGFSSQIASYMSSSVTLFVESPIYTEPADYAHENGYPCNLSRNLSTLSGYTEIDGEVEIGNIPCYEKERLELKQALMDGFYL